MGEGRTIASTHNRKAAGLPRGRHPSIDRFLGRRRHSGLAFDGQDSPDASMRPSLQPCWMDRLAASCLFACPPGRRGNLGRVAGLTDRSDPSPAGRPTQKAARVSLHARQPSRGQFDRGSSCVRKLAKGLQSAQRPLACGQWQPKAAGQSSRGNEWLAFLRQPTYGPWAASTAPAFCARRGGLLGSPSQPVHADADDDGDDVDVMLCWGVVGAWWACAAAGLQKPKAVRST